MNKIFKNYLLVASGAIIIGVGVAFVVYGNLGGDAMTTLEQGMHNTFKISLPLAQIIANLFFALLLFLLEKDRVNITVFGMVKNDKHQTRALMNDKREELEISQTLLNTITMFQDAVHDTAIGYHKKLRNEEVTRSALDNIKGIGTVKKVELLKKFGTVENMANASIEEIAELKGINEELAREIKKALQQ